MSTLSLWKLVKCLYSKVQTTWLIYLRDYDSLPKPIRDLCDTMDFNNSYAKCKDFIKKIEEYGYTCDYDLDGSVYDLKLINCNPT